MTAEPSASDASHLRAQWPFPTAAALGSGVRAKGIEQELRSRLPWTARGGLSVGGGEIVFELTEGEREKFEAGVDAVGKALDGIEALPVLPREVDDILAISPRERLKWTKDGRLKSAGTRTVKLRGRKKAVTFHVFEPHHIQDIADRDLASIWREEDAAASAENRKRAAARAASTRAGGTKPAPHRKAKTRNEAPSPKLEGWDAFETQGFLR